MKKLVLAVFALAFFLNCTPRQYVQTASCDFPLVHDGADLLVVAMGVAPGAPRGSAVYARKHAKTGKMCHFQVTTEDCQLWAISAAICDE